MEHFRHGGVRTSLVMCSLSRRMSTSCSLAAMGHAARSTRPAMQRMHAAQFWEAAWPAMKSRVHSWGTHQE